MGLWLMDGWSADEYEMRSGGIEVEEAKAATASVSRICWKLIILSS